MRVLGLIPARGGSKGLPGKNIRPLAGKSLIQRAFEGAVASGVVDRIVLSTDDAEIAAVAREFGLEVPFMRPARFAGDQSPMIDVAVDHPLLRTQFEVTEIPQIPNICFFIRSGRSSCCSGESVGR